MDEAGAVAVTFNPERKHIVTVDQEGLVQVWSSVNGKGEYAFHCTDGNKKSFKVRRKRKPDVTMGRCSA